MKFIVILNKRLETGVALNAAAHMAAGLVARAEQHQVSDMKFLNFVNKADGKHPSISARSLIVLRGTSNEIAKAKQEAIDRNILFTDFTSTMTGDTYVEQLERTRATGPADLEYYGLCMFGDVTELGEFTRKLSLWR